MRRYHSSWLATFGDVNVLKEILPTNGKAIAQVLNEKLTRFPGLK